MSLRLCPDCDCPYDDTLASTLCPHDPIVMRCQMAGTVDGRLVSRWALTLDDQARITADLAAGRMPTAGLDDLELVAHDHRAVAAAAVDELLTDLDLDNATGGPGPGPWDGYRFAGAAAAAIEAYDDALHRLGAYLAEVLDNRPG